MKGNHLTVTTLMMLVLIFSMLVAPVSAKNPSADISQLLSEFQLNMQETSLLGTINTNQEKGIKISKPEPSVKSAYNVTEDLLSYSDSLTTADPSDFYFFSVPDTRTIIFQLQSSNTNYRVDLYSINWSTGTASPVGLGYTIGSVPAMANDLTAGDWGLMVISSGTVGNTYRIDMNAAGPGGATSLESSTNTLNSVVWRYPNNDLYFNNTYIANTTQAANTNPNLDWTREFYFSSGGSYQSRTHEISDARVSYITTRVNYSSDYASSNNAVLIVLDEETLFTYHESEYHSGNPPYYYQSFVDTTGKVTPRRLDRLLDDMVNNPKFLAYDLNTNQVIDFVSNFNYYYAMGIEPMPTVTYYN